MTLTMANLSSLLGLTLSIVGSILLFRGTPLDTTGFTRLASVELLASADLELENRKRISKKGFGFLMVGFIFQWLSFFLPNTPLTFSTTAATISLPVTLMWWAIILSGVSTVLTGSIIVAFFYNRVVRRPRFHVSFDGGQTTWHSTGGQNRNTVPLSFNVVGLGVVVDWIAIATLEPSVSIVPSKTIVVPGQTWQPVSFPGRDLGLVLPVPDAKVIAIRNLTLSKQTGVSGLRASFDLNVPSSPISVQLAVYVKSRIRDEETGFVGSMFPTLWKTNRYDKLVAYFSQ